MYDELSSAKVALERIVQSQASSVGEKWHTSKNMFKLVAYILHMPGSNAFPESLFAHEHEMEN